MERYTFDNYIWDYKKFYDEKLTEEQKEEIVNSSNSKLVEIASEIYKNERLGFEYLEPYLNDKYNVKDIHQLKLVLPIGYNIINTPIILEFNVIYRALMKIREDGQIHFEDFNTYNNGVAYKGYGEHWFKEDETALTSKAPTLQNSLQGQL